MSELHPELELPEHGEPAHHGEVEVTPKTAPEQLEAAKAEQVEDLAEARDTVAHEAEPALDPLEQLRVEADEPAAPAASLGTISRESRKLTAARELHNLQRRLPGPERAFSKLIHQPAVQAVSEAAGKTVSRPSGLLGGGLVAFLGSGSYLYLAKHLGFRYNYLISTLLFLVGFAIGLGLELAVWIATRSRRSQD